MNASTFENFLPEHSIQFIKNWTEGYDLSIKISFSRKSKLGDYRSLPNQKHQISINGDLEKELFFFVLTHEIAHLISLSENPKIRSHGKEWKDCFSALLRESISVYPEDLQPLILLFSKNPKANYMASPEIVRYFNPNKKGNFVEDLCIGNVFEFKNERYQIIAKQKKRYLCENLSSGRKYLFRACAEVKKIDT